VPAHERSGWDLSGIPIELLGWQDGYSSTAQNFGPSELSSPQAAVEEMLSPESVVRVSRVSVLPASSGFLGPRVDPHSQTRGGLGAVEPPRRQALELPRA
jgi:hypothetical protein